MIRTNNIPRELLGWDGLTEKEKKEFDYLTSEDDRCSSLFFRYKGWTYALADFTPPSAASPLAQAWHGYHSDTAFSATLVKVVNDGESVICGQYFSD